jgi:hypothetical protein
VLEVPPFADQLGNGAASGQSLFRRNNLRPTGLDVTSSLRPLEAIVLCDIVSGELRPA